MKIKDIHPSDRPRERLLKYGIDRLSLVDLLSIIIGSGKKGMSALDMARKLAKHLDGKKLSIQNIQSIAKTGKTKAMQIMASLELGRRLFNKKKIDSILSPQDIWQELRKERESNKEYCIVFYLNMQNEVISKETISIGSLNANIVHPREVFEPAIRLSAAHIIICHNHPSGDSTPSEEDILLTKRLMKVGDIMGIEILDHVIVTKEKYLSMKERGIL